MTTALREIECGGERSVEPELYRVRGELLLIPDPPEEAEAKRYFRTAIDIAPLPEGEASGIARNNQPCPPA